ncbi:ABC transporter substrate-binding protein [Actinomadura viridis]|uniref:Multiple sugar transport system substrate-binding protein n=1 Tax=Actinomadura viridis TaxID=58110 RepID=A0A931DST4_9ACTN|nr:ABC transporter substrate-binding protein [Actinomadura viridis]MBG6092835.1 multiple sugar transport system substrate-binding protein [Actinomadura viridis]
METAPSAPARPSRPPRRSPGAVIGALGVVLAAAILAGCSSGDGTAALGTGPIVFADGRDTSRGSQIKRLVARWNDANPGERVEMVELSESTTDVRAQAVARAQDAEATATGEPAPVCYDVMTVDVIWTAEYAHWGYIVPLGQDDFDHEAFLGRTIDSVRYKGRLWGMPLRSDVGLLYYRADALNAANTPPPRTWEEMRQQARTIAPANGLRGYVTQLDRYEGFTVNTLESIWDSGGELLSRDGGVVATKDTIRKGFDRLYQGVQEGWIPRDTTGFNEERARGAFQDGRALFMRNWTYAYELLNAGDSPVKGRFGVAPLPTPSALGGWNLALSKCSKRRGTALRFMRYLTSEESERTLFAYAGFAPSRKALYEDAALQRAHPHLGVIRQGIEGSRDRGTSPYYDQISSAFQADLHQALTRPGGYDAELTRLTDDLRRAADGR